MRTDASYFIIMEDGQRRVMNVEDESGDVNKNVLRKLAKYRDNLRYVLKCPVNSAIKTSRLLEKCLTCLKLSETDILTPILRPIPRVDAGEVLNNILYKIENNYTFTVLEAFEILDVVRMFENNNHEILEKICYALPKIIIDSTDFFKFELIICMRCVIHKYAKTLEDIKRLEKVIGLSNVNTARQFFEDRIFNEGKVEGHAEGKVEGHAEGKVEGHAEGKVEGRAEGKAEGLSEDHAKGLSEGLSEGRLGMAIKFVEKFGVDAVVDVSGFSREELLNGKLSKYRVLDRTKF